MVRGSLYDLLKNNSKEGLPWSIRLKIAKDICAGLAYLHDQHILHRDMKSHNVLLDGSLHAKLSDFGLAQVKSESTRQSSGNVAGTLPWMAPELFDRGAKSTEASDVYALGMVLWEMSSYNTPFKDAENATQLIAWIKGGEREKIPEGTPPSYTVLISKCWAQRTLDRPKSTRVADSIREISVDEQPSVNPSRFEYFTQ